MPTDASYSKASFSFGLLYGSSGSISKPDVPDGANFVIVFPENSSPKDHDAIRRVLHIIGGRHLNQCPHEYDEEEADSLEWQRQCISEAPERHDGSLDW